MTNMLSYEQRHQPDELGFHKRPSGAQAEPIGSFLLLEDDPGDGSSILLLESDAGAQIDGLFLEDQP
jgi:hypothetical protein